MIWTKILCAHQKAYICRRCAIHPDHFIISQMHSLFLCQYLLLPYGILRTSNKTYRSLEWSGDYTTSFQDLLPGGKYYIPTDTTRDKVCMYSYIQVHALRAYVHSECHTQKYRTSVHALGGWLHLIRE